jgi:flavorubredoxin
MDHIPSLVGKAVDQTQPVPLYTSPQHSVYWVGSQEDSPFRCNVYLIVDGSVRVLVDPGSEFHHFAQVRERVSKLVPPESVTHIILHHQDPDLCDSIPAWLRINPEIILVCTPRTRVLLPYYGFPADVRWLDVSPNDSTVLELPSGKVLGFVTSPFLHFPEACTTFDETTGFLMSSDIGAAIERDWKLVIEDWEAHWRTMVPFHVFYMASNRAMQGFLKKISPFPVQAILPQHGSIIPSQHVKTAFAALRALPCGIDLLYPASNLESALGDLNRPR